MKLWKLAVIQLVLFGSFIYIMYSPSSNDDNFLQDSESVFFVTHDSSSSPNQPTNHPETPSSQDPNPTPPSTRPSTNQPEQPTSTGTPPRPDTPHPTTNSSTSQPGTGPQQPQPPTEPQQPVETTPPAPSGTDHPTVPEGPKQPTETPTTTTSPPEQPSQPTSPSTESPAPTEGQKRPWKGGAPVATPSINSTSVKGSGEEPKIIFKSQAENGKTCSQINQRQVKLCKVSLRNNCKRYHVSEELSSFWMISPIYTANNEQTDRLYYLHGNFRNYARSYGINFQTVEVIFPGQNEFLLTEPNNEPYDLQYHNDWIFAMRENLVNVGIKHLPDDWQYMAWIDQHIFWLDPYWFEKTILAFNKYNIVHMLNGNDFWNLQNTTDYYLEGFGRLWNQIGMGFVSHDPRQCGLAWGMRRDIFEQLGGLLDICIGTKCDLYQNYAYTGNRYTSQTGNWEYANMIGEWQDHAIKVYNRKLGFVDVKVVHFMHCTGTCKTSDYNQQIYALMQYNYNPRQHITRDDEGRMSLVNNLPLALRMWQIYGGPPRS